MSEPFRGVVNLDIRDSTPDWAPFSQPVAPPGTPNVVYVVLDDVGFGALSCYGGLIEPPTFEKSGEEPPGTAHGTLSLFYGDRKVGQGEIRTQPGYFSLAGEGLTVGRDSGEAVTDDYPGEAPWRFSGGTLHRVAVDVSGTPYLDLEREAAAMLSRE